MNYDNTRQNKLLVKYTRRDFLLYFQSLTQKANLKRCVGVD